MNLISIVNDGAELVSTNYWETSYGQTKFGFGANAGTMRLLVPTDMEEEIPEMIRDCDYVIVSTIRNPKEGKPSIEFLFEDHSSSPYSLHSCAGGALGYFPRADLRPVKRTITLWVNGPKKVATLPAYSREVPSLPWLKPLKLR